MSVVSKATCLKVVAGIQEAKRKHTELAPLWQNIDVLAEELDGIERAIADLSKSSIKLAKQVGP